MIVNETRLRGKRGKTVARPATKQWRNKTSTRPEGASKGKKQGDVETMEKNRPRRNEESALVQKKEHGTQNKREPVTAPTEKKTEDMEEKPSNHTTMLRVSPSR